MRVSIIGQQDFGKATLDAFLARGDDVAAVFCAPEKGRPDPLRLAAEQAAVPPLQFPPTPLPLHRGASSMSWSISLGRKETGFSIFRPTDGLDEGPVILSRAVPIEPEDTLGSLYFGKIFPMGVAGLIEAADL